jgi:hypothetical protein
MRKSGFESFIPGLLVSSVVILPILFAVSAAFFWLIEKPCMNPHWPLQVGDWIAGRGVRDEVGVGLIEPPQTLGQTRSHTLGVSQHSQDNC